MQLLGLLRTRRAELLVMLGVVVFISTLASVFMRAYPTFRMEPAPVLPRVVEGDQLPLLAGYSWQSHPNTLILALHVGCPYCEASMEFYERLYTLEKRQFVSAHVLAIFNDPASEVQKELPPSLHGLPVYSGVDFASWHIGATPTVILAGQRGVAERVWRGKLSTELENQIIDAVQALHRPLGVSLQ